MKTISNFLVKRKMVNLSKQILAVRRQRARWTPCGGSDIADCQLKK